MNIIHRKLFASVGFLIIIAANNVCASNTDSEDDYLKTSSVATAIEHLQEIVWFYNKSKQNPNSVSLSRPLENVKKYQSLYFQNDDFCEEGEMQAKDFYLNAVLYRNYYREWGQAALYIEAAEKARQFLKQYNGKVDINNVLEAQFLDAQKKSLEMLRIDATFRAANLLDGFDEFKFNSRVVGLALLDESRHLLHAQPEEQVKQATLLLARAEKALKRFPEECKQSELFMDLCNYKRLIRYQVIGSTIEITDLGDDTAAVINRIQLFIDNLGKSQESA